MRRALSRPEASRPRRGSRGYTVVEVMMALAVLTLSASGVIAIQKATLIANTNARNLVTANAIAQSWVERLRADAQSWNEQGNVPDISQTAWLTSASGSPPASGGGWFTPNVINYGSSFPAGTSEADVMGADLLRAADKTSFGTAFCTQIRLTRFNTNKTGNLAPFYRTVRIEVRVAWDRVGGQLDCTAMPTGWDTDVGRYGSVYLVSAALENAAPF
ncbi:MAG: prepilin-type N-terminal cleavage/methylation domain-containing protein [Minicystis sp.]